MQQSRSRPRAFMVLLGLIAIVASACSGTTASTAPSTAPTAAPSTAVAATATPPPAITPVPVAPDAPGPNGGVVISWFVGLGAGAQPQQLQAEATFVNDFNASQKEVYIALEIQNNNVAAQKLKTRIAAGDPPDIIGPVGVEGLNLFRDNLLDLAPLIAKTGYTVPGVDPKLVDFFKLGANNATIGVPYAVYPSYMYFNKDLFDEAGLPYPPTKVGELYQGKPWDMDAVRALGMKLTVDAAGNDATSAKFDPTKVVQWGFDMQYADNSPLAETSLFGASSFLAS
ncbi:MAG: ABC transporter substrate-binding protein, partial [Acidimicrobiales bacterium]